MQRRCRVLGASCPTTKVVGSKCLGRASRYPMTSVVGYTGRNNTSRTALAVFITRLKALDTSIAVYTVFRAIRRRLPDY